MLRVMKATTTATNKAGGGEDDDVSAAAPGLPSPQAQVLSAPTSTRPTDPTTPESRAPPPSSRICRPAGPTLRLFPPASHKRAAHKRAHALAVHAAPARRDRVHRRGPAAGEDVLELRGVSFMLFDSST